MKVVILAGGMGTRLAEETSVRPKPMVEIGGRPILWHIMQHYLSYGFGEFVVALGYKADVVKRYFLDYPRLQGDLSIDMISGESTRLAKPFREWTVKLVETGEGTNTGGRVRRLKPLLCEGTFMLTWCDGVSDVNLQSLLEFHRRHGKVATVTAVRRPARFGHLTLDDACVAGFQEKPQTGDGWINGAFFVLEPKVFDYIADDNVSWEQGPMRELAQSGQLMAYRHEGFWQCMDTMAERQALEDLWNSGRAPWKVWA